MRAAPLPILLTNNEGRGGVQTAAGLLCEGRSALDALEAGIRLVESDPEVLTVGRGGAPNLLGDMECDAAVMDGATLSAGSVAALRGYLHPVSVARQVMERLPHVMLAGPGAARFAAECGAETDPMLTPGAARNYQAWIEKVADRPDWREQALAPLCWQGARPDIARGTTIYLGRDRDGNLAAAASTSGWAYKYPGRIGDSPLIGAGLYADNRWGAAACTHTGEMTIRAGTARSVVLYMKKGATVEEACREAALDLTDLRGGYLGPVIIHAMDRNGEIFVQPVHSEQPPGSICWTEDEGIRRIP